MKNGTIMPHDNVTMVGRSKTGNKTRVAMSRDAYHISDLVNKRNEKSDDGTRGLCFQCPDDVCIHLFFY